MDSNLQHEDLLIKLRAKLNEEKVKLWEPPYISADNEITQHLKDLASKYSKELSVDDNTALEALHELQLHSIERSKANAEFKETGFATFRVKATIPGEEPKTMKLQKKLDIMGSELITSIADNLGVPEIRVKLIVNGRVIKASPSIAEQGAKNGTLIMALVMAETPDQVKKEDTMYMEMKSVRDDATLLSEHVDELANDNEYMRLEDQSGKAVELPQAEKRSLLVGLALHERGRAAAKQHDYALALVLLLEADRQLSECRSSILKTVDNWGILQLDVAWCYLRLQSLSHAADVAARLVSAEAAFKESYGEDHQRLIALKGNAANERVLFMRLYLLQGIVAYHQNNRTEARRLLEKAEQELNMLRVDAASVLALVELGWSPALARTGLRAARGDPGGAHHYLAERAQARDRARAAQLADRQRRLLGLCIDGSAVSQQLVEALIAMGYTRKMAAGALRNSNNIVAEAVRLIQEQPHLLQDMDDLSDDESLSSDESTVQPDKELVTELQAMGYEPAAARAALARARNDVGRALDLLQDARACDNEPSTSSAAAARKRQKKLNREKRQERELALSRLTSAIKSEEDDYLDTSLVEEEEILVQYKSLL